MTWSLQAFVYYEFLTQLYDKNVVLNYTQGVTWTTVLGESQLDAVSINLTQECNLDNRTRRVSVG